MFIVHSRTIFDIHSKTNRYSEWGMNESLHRVSQKKRTADFQYIAKEKCHILIAYDKVFSTKKNDAKIVKFGSVILILWQFYESLLFSIFRQLSRMKVPRTAFYTVVES